MSNRFDLLRELAPRVSRSRPIRSPGSPLWSRDNLAGRLTEISGRGATASLTAAVGLVLDAQRQGEPVAWITLPATAFYPPDLHQSGVDMDALAVVRVPAARDAAHAADCLLRSGAFGLVILDVGSQVDISLASQGRLAGLALKHDAAVVVLTAKPGDAPSIGSMVSLRVEVTRERGEGEDVVCKISALKDKQRGPCWSHGELVCTPPGLR